MKKLLSLILAMAMLLSLGTTAFALDVPTKANDEASEAFYNTVSSAEEGATIELEGDVSYEIWKSVWGKKSLTINGNGYTITVDSVSSDINGGALLREAENLTINNLNVVFTGNSIDPDEWERVAIIKSGTLNNVSVSGGHFGVSVVGEGPVTIENCNFSNIAGFAIETENKGSNASLTINKTIFDGKAVILRGENNTFTNNKLLGSGEGVNVLGTTSTSGSAVISGNDFGSSILGIGKGVDLTLEGNTIESVELHDDWVLNGDANATYDNVEIGTNTLGTAALETLKTIDENVVSSVKVASFGDNSFYTIQEAINAAAEVASPENPVTIQLIEGEIEQSFRIPQYIDSVTIKGAENYKTVLKNSSVGHSGGNNAAMNNITFDGIDFDGSNIGLTAIYANTKINNMTIKNCKFHNIVNNTAVLINTNSLPNLNGFTFTGNTIENVTSNDITKLPSGLVLRAAPTGNIVITDNNISNVTHNAIQVVGAQKDATLTVTGNTFASGAEEGVVNLYGTNCGVVLENNTINTTEGQLAIAHFSAVAKIGNKEYASLTAAVAAAQTGETVTILDDMSNVDLTISNDIILDLGGKTITDAYIIVSGDVTIKNGDIVNINEPYPLVVQNGGELTVENVDIEASKSDRAIWVRDNSTLNFNSGSILSTKGENNTKTSLIAAIYTNSNTQVNISGGTITVDTPDNKAVGIFGNYANANVTITGGKISTSGKNYSYGINVDGDITVSGGEIVTNEKGYGYSSGIRYGSNYALVTATGDVTVSGGKITTNGYSGYMVNVGRTYSSNDQTITITDVDFENTLTDIERTKGGHKNPVLIWEGSASNVTASISGGKFVGTSENLLRGDNTDLEITGGVFEVMPAAEFLADGAAFTKTADGYKVLDAETAKTEAGTVYMQFREVEAEEGEKKYEIVIVGKDKATINRLTAADLAFTFDPQPSSNVKMDYKVTAAEWITLTKPAKDRFAFNFDGVNKPDSGNVAEVVLGTITVSGYGTFTLKVNDEATTNQVHATTLEDNLVDTFIVGGDLNKGEGVLVINKQMDAEGTPDATDGLLGKIEGAENAAPKRELTINVKFPNTVVDQAAAYMDMTVTISGGDLASAIVVNLGEATGNDASYVIEKLLTKDFTYNVTIEGAGYRTYDCAVKMTGNKTLTFWNNVRTGEFAVEEGNTATNETVTFLAGDIVKDNNINIYDLSAVVSYFATNAPSVAAKWDYAKYDLNRDGSIDSKDVAYILVSWGK